MTARSTVIACVGFTFAVLAFIAGLALRPAILNEAPRTSLLSPIEVGYLQVPADG
ncbi:hypothetical protein [Gordonia sp. (in: high G+C Gram-positive bacteria)]|uniref:hypothetical protein n=1 Tax=Gordonia sp. (in: high G+C Gram-positive bacteria) TaxID=84139 RepID=UPI003C74AC59